MQQQHRQKNAMLRQVCFDGLYRPHQGVTDRLYGDPQLFGNFSRFKPCLPAELKDPPGLWRQFVHCVMDEPCSFMEGNDIFQGVFGNVRL